MLLCIYHVYMLLMFYWRHYTEAKALYSYAGWLAIINQSVSNSLLASLLNLIFLPTALIYLLCYKDFSYALVFQPIHF